MARATQAAGSGGSQPKIPAKQSAPRSKLLHTAYIPATSLP